VLNVSKRNVVTDRKVDKAALTGVSHAAHLTGLSEGRIRQLCNVGTIPCIKDALGRRLFDEAGRQALINYASKHAQA
jgi:hypothetical protein